MNIHDAKTHLSKYLELIEKGEETIVVCRNGKPVAQLVKCCQPHKRQLGGWKGKVRIADDFDELPEDFMEYFTKDTV